MRELQRRRGRLADQLGAALELRVRAPQTAALPGRGVKRRGWLAPTLGATLLAGAAWFATPGSRERSSNLVDTTPDTVTATPSAPDSSPSREPAAPRLPSPTSREPATPASGPAATSRSADAGAKKRDRPRAAEPASGRLLVNLVPWAEASVDGRALGRTPIAVGLPVGRHRLVLVNPELGQQRSREITIERGADTRIIDW